LLVGFYLCIFCCCCCCCCCCSTYKLYSTCTLEQSKHMAFVNHRMGGCVRKHYFYLYFLRFVLLLLFADVTYFVHPDTPLDKEAAHRSTSTYLVERRLDMLPGLLTTQLCSLRSKEGMLQLSLLLQYNSLHR
jgi:hypothetical protein